MGNDIDKKHYKELHQTVKELNFNKLRNISVELNDVNDEFEEVPL